MLQRHRLRNDPAEGEADDVGRRRIAGREHVGDVLHEIVQRQPAFDMSRSAMAAQVQPQYPEPRDQVPGNAVPARAVGAGSVDGAIVPLITWDTAQLARATGVSERTWERRRVAGDSLPCLKCGSCVLYLPDQVTARLRRQAVTSTSAATVRYGVAA